MLHSQLSVRPVICAQQLMPSVCLVCVQEANDDLDTELLDMSVEESFKVSFTP